MTESNFATSSVRAAMNIVLTVSTTCLCSRKSCGAIVAKPQLFAFAFTIAQITLGVKPSPEILPALLMDRGNGPAFIPAPKFQLSTDCFTHAGTGMVRIWPPFAKCAS
jgi:hypothetical protein